jgi:hypothetical protein
MWSDIVQLCVMESLLEVSLDMLNALVLMVIQACYDILTI